jgi:predicted dehydrogenase
MKSVNVGIIGCGDIARRAYVSGVRLFGVLETLRLILLI